MRKLLLPFLLFSLWSSAQNHVDLLKINYGETFQNNFKNTSHKTAVNIFETQLLFPVPLNSSQTLISGIDFNKHNLQLFPTTPSTDLYSTTLQLGLASEWNDKWRSTLISLPKLAADYKNLSNKDFYLGIYALLKYKKQENFIYRFGFYASQEAYGIFTTPVLGWYYQSPNKRFQMDMNLPIDGDINYKFKHFTLGIDYFGISRSFRVHYKNNPTLYADLNSLDFSTYFQINALQESVLLRAKFGYSTHNYKMYEEEEKIGLGFSAFNLNDHRTPLNPKFQGGFFIKAEAIYRFHIPQQKKN